MTRHPATKGARRDGTLQCYALFHLNLAFSSIEEADRRTVVERCYWPLIELVRRRHLPVAIEAPAYTLETAARIDPDWLAAFRTLVTDGPAELIGSGYAQIIGPLAPSDVVRANLAAGHRVYERLPGIRPSIAFVNEQTWSASLTRHYREAGFAAAIMEWENPRATHPEWPAEWQYQPQRACGQDCATIPLLWSHTIAFQKLQRLAHGEIEIDEYLAYIRSHRGAADRTLAIYASDAEIFDYRPGRYRTEPPLPADSEWHRIETAFMRLAAEPGIALVTPSAVLAGIDRTGAGSEIHLETAEKPAPVKKQPKYDLARWAVTGRDDLGVNTACWRAYDALRYGGGTESDWQELCYLWSSDFRTHITNRRWSDYVDRLTNFVDRLNSSGTVDATAGPQASAAAARQTPRVSRSQRRVMTPDDGPDLSAGPSLTTSLVSSVPKPIAVAQHGRYLTVETPSVKVRLNCRRGLAVDAFTAPAIAAEPLCGSVPHGYFGDIAWSADQYTGFLVLAASGQPQVTDLEPTDPTVGWDPECRSVVVRGCVRTSLGVLEKQVTVAADAPRIAVRYRLHWSPIPLGTLRLGHVTLMPGTFDPASLFIATHNGGDTLERFDLAGRDVDHIVPVSHLVSCRGGLGATEGIVEIGDVRTVVQIGIDRYAASLFPLVTMRQLGPRYFCRLTLSARELDDTSRPEGTGRSRFIDEMGFSITARRA
jgi:hypothetical protein